MAEWTVSEPGVVDVDEPVASLDVRLIGGHVDVVPCDEAAARIEISELDGPPLHVSCHAGRLVIAHEELRWEGVLGWLRVPRRTRRAVVSVAVPASSEVRIAVVAADAVVAGVSAPVRVRSVSGDVTLDGTTGEVVAESVSGDVEARGLGGSVSMKSVSGNLTVVDGAPVAVKVRSVSGDVTMDLATNPSIDATTVSGDVTVRLPDDAGLDVDVVSTSGDVASVFDGLSVSARPGAKKLHGRVGSGAGTVRGRTVSGSVSLLARAGR